jgi:hypothetical protein
MSRGRTLHPALVAPALALLALVTVFGAAPSFADRKAQATRSSGGEPQAVAKAPASGSSVSASRGSSRASRGTARPRTAVSTRQSTPATRQGIRGSRRPHRHHHYGFHLGFGHYYPWGSWYWGPGYWYPYYWGAPYWGVPYWGSYHVPRHVRAEYNLGAFDLNVRPKKTEVFLNGQAIGQVKQFDGWPDYLWLQEGEYELIFYRSGYATERRLLRIIPGVVSDVRLELVAGEAVAPSELSAPPEQPRAGALAEVEEAYRRQSQEARPAPPAPGERDTRTPPGRLRLTVLPADASVYLDGRLLGSGEELSQLHAGLVVEAGSHLLEVVRPGYATEQLEFAVEEGSEVELEVLLEAG